MDGFDFSNVVYTANGTPRAADVVAFAPDEEASRWKVLVIERGSEPFKGHRCFPGGFMDSSVDDRPGDTAARELLEETGLSVQAPEPFTDEMPPSELVSGRLVWLGHYDAPGRDPRMPVTSDVYVAVLDEEPSVAGADDAAHAEFVFVDEILEQLQSTPSGEDHVLAFDHDKVMLDATELLKRFDASPSA